MKVYRLLSETELKNIISGNYRKIGAEYNNSRYPDSNNHLYKRGVKYLHFFKHKDAIKYMEKYKYNDNQTYYICTFDIPFLQLIKGIGSGKYELPGMDYLIITEREYIIPSEKFKKEWLKSYKKDEAIAKKLETEQEK